MQIATFPIKVNDALQTASALSPFEASLDKGELRNGKQHKRFLVQAQFHLRLSRETAMLDAMMDSSAWSESQVEMNEHERKIHLLPSVHMPESTVYRQFPFFPHSVPYLDNKYIQKSMAIFLYTLGKKCYNSIRIPTLN